MTSWASFFFGAAFAAMIIGWLSAYVMFFLSGDTVIYGLNDGLNDEPEKEKK